MHHQRGLSIFLAQQLGDLCQFSQGYARTTSFLLLELEELLTQTHQDSMLL